MALKHLSTGFVDIYEVKRSQCHLLATIENNTLHMAQ